VVESIIRRLGTFSLDDEKCRWFPLLPKFLAKSGSERAFSPSQATSLAVIVSSILHAMFFVIMGTKAGFWALFGAYALAAFARCILTSEFVFLATSFFSLTTGSAPLYDIS